MKKINSTICIFMILLLTFLLVEYAQLRKPSYFAINNAVSWAESLVGKSRFPYYGGGGSSTSILCCTYFVANSYGEVSAPNFNAVLYWTTLVDQHPGDWDAPRGSLVFFDQNARNFGLGHVALCTGNGKIVEAGDYAIKSSTIRDANNNAPYLGWAWPPPSWLGRSEGSAAVVFIINMDNFIKKSMTSALLKLNMQ